MPTDYDLAGFATSYNAARALTKESMLCWISRLAGQARAEDVSTVLDVGSGTGRFWPVLQAAWSPMSIIAVDRSLEMLRGAKTLPNVLRIVGDLEALPLRQPGGFDVVFCSMVLHYSRDPHACVKKVLDFIRPDGWLFVRTGTTETLDSFDFLRYFPSALAAERLAMPARSQVVAWLVSERVEVVAEEMVTAGAPSSRWHALRSVLSRGFPSLQGVSRRELMVGLVRYSAHLALTWLTGTARIREQSLLITARNRP